MPSEDEKIEQHPSYGMVGISHADLCRYDLVRPPSGEPWPAAPAIPADVWALQRRMNQALNLQADIQETLDRMRRMRLDESDDLMTPEDDGVFAG